MLPHTQYEIAVIGAGNAAEGIVHGLLRRSVLLENRIIAAMNIAGVPRLIEEGVLAAWKRSQELGR